MTQIIFPSLYVIAALLLLGAALHDAVARTIPNWVSVCLVAVGLVLRLHDGSYLVSVIVAIVLFIVLLLLWLRGFIGGGDMKLIPAVSLVVPPTGVPSFILSVAIAGGVLALVYLGLSHMVRRPSPGRRHGLFARVVKAEAWRLHRRGPLPYAVAIAGGAFPFLFQSFSG